MQGTVEADVSQSGYVGRIPVRNVWLLMLYASDLFAQMGQQASSVENNPDDIPALVAEILTHAVAQRTRRHLNAGFVARRDELHRVRGRIDMLTTTRRGLLEKAKVACRFEELTVDTLRNRLVLAALDAMARLVRGDLMHRCRLLAGLLHHRGVSKLTPTHREIDAMRYGRQDMADRLMLAAAKLALNLALPTEEVGRHHLYAPDRDEVWARKLFEKAVAGFYKITLPASIWRVYPGKTLNWQVSQMTSGMPLILPSMRTDIVLECESTARRVVIDTKFNAIVTRAWYRDESLRSGYIYQMYAYLRSQVNANDALSEHASGLLLHPSVGHALDESVAIQGQTIRFATVDLTAPATEIRVQLLRLIEPSIFEVANDKPIQL